MRNSPLRAKGNNHWFSKFLPDWAMQSSTRRIVYLFVLACIYWQVSDRLDTEQILLTLKYAGAHIVLFVSLDPEGTMNISLSGNDYQVSRETVAYMLQLDAEWKLCCEGIVYGFGLALLFLFVLLIWSFGTTGIEKEHLEKKLSQHGPEFETERPKNYREARLKSPEPETPKLIHSTEAEPKDDFETTSVESLADLIEESENDVSNSNPAPEKPPAGKPLRLPGRIYRDGS